MPTTQNVIERFALRSAHVRVSRHALSPLDPDDEFRTKEERKRLLNCLFTALSDVPSPWSSHRADLEALVTEIAKDQSDPGHEHLRAVMRACLQDVCGARENIW